MATIYIVEDDVNIREIERYALKNSGYEVEEFESGESMFKRLERAVPSLLLLDIMLPDEDGLEILGKLRANKNTAAIPIIMVTAKTSELDKVKGLDLGADDYIPKPFNPLEVVARVKTQLRRCRNYNNPLPQEQKNEYDIRGLYINRDSHKCTLYGKEVTLTPLEFSVLWYLCDNQGRVVPSEELFEAVWGEKYLNSNNTVMAHIGRLREKLHEPARSPKFIKTVWGVGYTIE